MFWLVIIGFGLVGFYMVYCFMKNNEYVKVDMYEFLLVFYGFVRFGVVLDYVEVKVGIYDVVVFVKVKV